jgi:esterase
LSAVDLHHDISGTDAGRDVVILHGLFGMGRNWAGIAHTLGDRYRCFTVDLRNHGNSPWADEMTYETMAADVARLIERHCHAPAAVVGHSMGGKTAMTLALSQPELVERVCAVDIAPVPYDHNFEGHIRAMANLDTTALARRSEAETALLEALDDVSLVRFLVRNLKADPASGGFVWGVNLDALARHMDDILDFPVFEADDAYEGPALFMSGSVSEYVQPHHQGEIERLFPNVQTEIVDGAGHWLHADRPERTAALLRAFLDARPD